MRKAGKALLERVLASFPARIQRRRMRGKRLVLAYHNICHARGVQGDRSLHLAREEFRRQLDFLATECEVIPLSRIFDPPDPAGRVQVALTFDDAYQGALTWGLELIAGHDFPVTIFVAPGLLNGMEFWWDVLADSGEGLSPAIRDHALEQLAGSQERVLRWAKEQRLPLTPMPTEATGGTLVALQDAAAYGQLDFAVHTMTHPNLARLPDGEVAAELTAALQWLRSRLPRVQPYVAYPYGRTSDRVSAICENAGFQAGFLVSGGWLTPRCHRFALPRLNIPSGMSLQGFILRLSGLFRH